MALARFARDHSLSLALLALGLLFLAASLPIPEGKGFDLVSGFGMGFLLAALLNLMAGPLRERNRADE
jgi:hypothetical protein